MSATVLVVDDDDDNVQIVSTILHERGYEVRIARDGQSALESVLQQRPDVILLDVMMPGVHGMQVLGHLKRGPKSASIPVVMETGIEALYGPDRKSTRLNSSHVKISYAVFCLKKKKTKTNKRITQSSD